MIKRRNHGSGHSYIEVDDAGQKIGKVPGVTTIIRDGIPKPQFAVANVRSVAHYAMDNWDKLCALPMSERVKELTAAQYADRNRAGARGTKVHALASKLIHGERVVVPDDLLPYVTQYVRFLDEWDVAPILVETTVVNRAHRYCGTLDLLAELDDPLEGPGHRSNGLLDIATNASGVWGERRLQLAGYLNAEAYLDQDAIELPLPPVDWCGAVWVQPEFYRVMPLDVDAEQFRVFLAAKLIGEWAEGTRDGIGDPLPPPGTPRYRVVLADEPEEAPDAE